MAKDYSNYTGGRSFEEYEKLSGYSPNVEMIRNQGHKFITNSIPRDVRRELSKAVKKNQLGHLIKDGLKPEVYFHPDFLHLVKDLRKQIEQDAKERISKVYTYTIVDVKKVSK